VKGPAQSEQQKYTDTHEAALTFLRQTRTGKYAKVEESSLLCARLSIVTEEEPTDDSQCCLGYR